MTVPGVDAHSDIDVRSRTSGIDAMHVRKKNVACRRPCHEPVNVRRTRDNVDISQERKRKLRQWPFLEQPKWQCIFHEASLQFQHSVSRCSPEDPHTQGEDRQRAATVRSKVEVPLGP